LKAINDAVNLRLETTIFDDYKNTVESTYQTKADATAFEQTLTSTLEGKIEAANCLTY
jgi:hypothetical protein